MFCCLRETLSVYPSPNQVERLSGSGPPGPPPFAQLHLGFGKNSKRELLSPWEVWGECQSDLQILVQMLWLLYFNRPNVMKSL